MKTARLLRWVGQLDDVLLHSGADDRAKEDAAFQASTSNETTEEAPSLSSSSSSPPQPSSNAAAGEMCDLRNACAALASELRAELDAPAVAAAAAKEKSKENATGDEIQEDAATSRSEALVEAPVGDSGPDASAGNGEKSVKEATLRPPLRGKELAKRLATGWGLGAACTAWIFSGNLGHAAGLYLLAIVAQVGCDVRWWLF